MNRTIFALDPDERVMVQQISYDECDLFECNWILANEFVFRGDQMTMTVFVNKIKQYLSIPLDLD